MKMRHWLAGLLVLCIGAPAAIAATFSQRSPFVQGHWWNRDRSGSGFDIFNTSEQAVIVWYTYDEAGKPTWYIAQGATATLGTQTWALVQQRWVNGKPSGLTTAGSVRLEIVNPESIRVNWQVGTHSGQWSIEPFVASGIESEVDHSGHWYNPANSGWGVTLTEQGDVLGAVAYTYDANGDPTWVAGFDRQAAQRKVPMYATHGACPWCAYTATQVASAGSLTFDYLGEAQLVLHSTVTTPMAVNVDGAHVIQLGRAASTRPADRQLAAFDSDAALKTYLDAGMLNVPFNGSLIQFSAGLPSTTAAFSTTNVQEQGVDESDLLKTDGHFAYAYRYNPSGLREPAIRIAEIGTDGSSLAFRGEALLASGSATPMSAAGLYVSGGRLVSVTGTQPVSFNASAWAISTAWLNGQVNIEVLDASATATPRWRAKIDGHLVASRRIGDKLYVVSRFVPAVPGFQYGFDNPGNRALLAATPLANLLPKVQVNGGAAAPLIATSALSIPPQGSNPAEADIVVLTTIDLAAPAIVQALGVVGPVETVYVSPTNLYLATRRTTLRIAQGALVPNPSPSLVTDIHAFALENGAARFVGSASVEGFLASDVDEAPFRMSESQGRLRVVTSTTQVMSWGIRNQANTLTILEPSALSQGLLRTVSILPNAARPEPLGKPFEELHATRYVGDRLYAVTFPIAQRLSADPLYAVDLSDAADPKILGSLVVPGFSDYLHPLSNGMLLGFGRDVTLQGAQLGLQLSLFDVSSVAAPRVVQQISIGKAGSDSALLRDHHAISVLEHADGTVQVALPVSLHGGVALGGSGDSATYAWMESGLMRFQVPPSPSAGGIQALAPIVTDQVPQPVPVNDAAVSNGRSIQFPLGTVYVGNGRFWLLQSASGTVSGPF
jgi:hypothetical protein